MSAPVIYVTATSCSSPTFSDYMEYNQIETAQPKGRKRRLDHLTWEEKMQRKKLKNRVAAQTSRDRKKAKMEEMESAMKEILDKNDALLNECRELRNMNKKLMSENTELSRKLSSQTCSQCCHNQSRLVNCSLSNGPAVSYTSPLPQGQGLQLATGLSRRQNTLIILKIVLAYLLCQTSSQTQTSTQNSTLTSFKSSLKAYSKISPQTWKQLLTKDRLHQVVCKKITQDKWWGRHQSMWNPVELQV